MRFGKLAFVNHMSFNPREPFNHLPMLPPRGEVETRAVLKKCVDASRALAGLNGAIDSIPNPDMLINSIPLQEAKLSSQIENIVTTNDKLYRASLFGDDEADPHTKEVLQYRTALRRGFDALDQRPLSTNLFRDICGTVLGKEIDVRRVTGTTLTNPANGEVVYTPPVGADLIRRLLSNLEEFLNKVNDLDPLVKAAIAHYQFEAIHPFHDGNGRTGRILVILYLVQRGLLRLPVIYLSRYIIDHKPEYYRLLRGVTEEEDWESFILFMLEATRAMAALTHARIDQIRSHFNSTVARVRQQAPEIYSKELIELLFIQPYCRIATLEQAGLVERKAASRYLKRLEEIGVLEAVKLGRELVFIHPALLQIITG